MARIHTRTNNVDTRVQGLFYSYMRTHNDPGKVWADTNVFYLQRSTASQIRINHANKCAYLV